MKHFDKKFSRKKSYIKWILAAVVVVLAVFLIWANFFYFKDCENQECFDDYLAGCNHAKFLGGEKMIFEYKILGTSGDFCRVNVELLQGDLNNEDSLKLKNKEMVCLIPLSVVTSPESDIGNCHGLLKEGLQDLVISKLHRYIVQNIGAINEEISGF